MSFYEYNQNNSGGSFVFDRARGITQYVIIEAEDADQADIRAEEIGLYFNGCDDGIDCSCCGDRWYGAYGKGDPVPSHYGEPITETLPSFGTTFRFLKDSEPACAIHYLDGRVEWRDYAPPTS